MSDSSRTDPTSQATSKGASQGGGDRKGVARLFDVRLVIGGLLTVYGLILTIQGIADNHAAVAKAAGVRINLWTGIGLLAVGAFFLVWVKLAPLQAVRQEDVVDETSPDAR
jgi:xanthine/uracil/vitamin C permease (AzgA family)